MLNIGIFDNTNYNYILKFLRENYSINLINDFKIYNAFSNKNMLNFYDVLLIIAELDKMNIEKIKHVIKKSRILIINGDDKKLNNLLLEEASEEQYVINYGFNSKSTITISSIDKLENKVLCSLQREIYNIYNKTIEPKELLINKGKSNFNNYKLLGIISLILILGYIY